MKLHHKLIAAASLALVGVHSFAAVLSEDSYADGDAFVYEFSARTITAAESGSTFTFTLDGSDPGFAALSGVYSLVGDISSSKYKLTGITLNGVSWNLAGGTSNVDLGSLAITPTSVLEIDVTGDRLGSGSNFQGSVVLTAVPEPETYALMLAGLGAVAFVARRRRQQ